jgi:hypothetical protein
MLHDAGSFIDANFSYFFSVHVPTFLDASGRFFEV